MPYANAVPLVAPEHQFKLLCEKGRKGMPQSRGAHGSAQVVLPETAFDQRRPTSAHWPIFRRCDADVEQVFPIART
tara:strand:- start:88 stop:315 length:228 start_codon:yes stop_codon:yes gene_type:complete